MTKYSMKNFISNSKTFLRYGVRRDTEINILRFYQNGDKGCECVSNRYRANIQMLKPTWFV